MHARRKEDALLFPVHGQAADLFGSNLRGRCDVRDDVVEGAIFDAPTGRLDQADMEVGRVIAAAGRSVRQHVAGVEALDTIPEQRLRNAGHSAGTWSIPILESGHRRRVVEQIACHPLLVVGIERRGMQPQQDTHVDLGISLAAHDPHRIVGAPCPLEVSVGLLFGNDHGVALHLDPDRNSRVHRRDNPVVRLHRIRREEHMVCEGVLDERVDCGALPSGGRCDHELGRRGSVGGDDEGVMPCQLARQAVIEQAPKHIVDRDLDDRVAIHSGYPACQIGVGRRNRRPRWNGGRRREHAMWSAAVRLSAMFAGRRCR